MSGGTIFAGVTILVATGALIAFGDWISDALGETLRDVEGEFSDSDSRTAALANDLRRSRPADDLSAGGSGSQERQRASNGGTQQRDASTQHPRCGGF